MDVLIIGAGLSGLACAHTLTAHGATVTLVDKGRGPGGRLATRRFAGGSFDTGAQFFSVRDPTFAAAVRGWEEAGLAVPWSDGFPLLGGADGRDGHPRWRIAGGMNRLAKHLAAGLDLRDQRTVTGLAATGHRWRVTVTPGDLAKPGAQAGGPPEELSADAVVLTAPGPQAAQLLERCGLAVDPRLAAVRYDPCLCLLLEFPDAPGALLPVPGGLRLDDDPAIAWIASQRAKDLRATGDGLVLHTRGAWAAERYQASDEAILAELRPAALAALRRAGITAEPAAMQLKKWKYSLPTVLVDEPCLLVPGAAGSGPLVIAGDSLGGRARVEGAWLSGVAAAVRILTPR